jgi:hypothetical protein
MAEYWQQVHVRGGLAEVRAALTGAHLADHVDFLKVAEQVVPGKRVLCIGVGLGGWVWELSQLGVRVSVLDVCPAAIGKVKSFAKGYLPDDPMPAGEFDLALSHWVSPHMTEPALAAQMRQVVPAMARGGIFALQFCEPLGWVKPNDPQLHGMDEDKRHQYARSLFTRAELQAMAEAAGGKLLGVPVSFEVPSRSMSVCAAHVRGSAG